MQEALHTALDLFQAAQRSPPGKVHLRSSGAGRARSSSDAEHTYVVMQAATDAQQRRFKKFALEAGLKDAHVEVLRSGKATSAAAAALLRGIVAKHTGAPGRVALASGQGQTTPDDTDLQEAVAEAATGGWQVALHLLGDAMCQRFEPLAKRFPNVSLRCLQVQDSEASEAPAAAGAGAGAGAAVPAAAAAAAGAPSSGAGRLALIMLTGQLDGMVFPLDALLDVLRAVTADVEAGGYDGAHPGRAVNAIKASLGRRGDALLAEYGLAHFVELLDCLPAGWVSIRGGLQHPSRTFRPWRVPTTSGAFVPKAVVRALKGAWYAAKPSKGAALVPLEDVCATLRMKDAQGVDAQALVQALGYDSFEALVRDLPSVFTLPPVAEGVPTSMRLTPAEGLPANAWGRARSRTASSGSGSEEEAAGAYQPPLRRPAFGGDRPGRRRTPPKGVSSLRLRGPAHSASAACAAASPPSWR